MKHAEALRSTASHARHVHQHAHKHPTRSLRSRMPELRTFVVEHLLVLPAGAVLALIWVHTNPELYYRTAYALSFVVNDILMVLFFGLMTKEIVEATAPGGVLHSWRRLISPLVAATGATLLPALLYVPFVDRLDQPMLRQAWLIPCAVDIALGYFLARVIFGRHPVVPFFLMLALAANGLAFLMLGLFFPSRALHLGYGAALMVAALASASALRRRRIRSFWPYMMISGGLSWAALYVGGFHPAFALVPVMPFLPHAPRDPGFFVDASPHAHDALSRFEIIWKYPGQVALFLFALVNGGVELHGLENGAWAVPMAAVIGKPLGILVAVGIGTLAAMHVPEHIGWRELVVVGFIASVGFTLALFFASAALAPGQILNETKAGVLVALAGVALAPLAAWLFGVGRFRHRRP